MIVRKITYYFRKSAEGQYSIERLFHQLSVSVANHYQVYEQISSWPSRGLINRVRMVREAAKNQADVNHITGDIYFVAIGLKRSKTILTVHDLGFMRHPNLIARLLLWIFWVYWPLRRVNYVTTISAQSKKDIVRYGRVSPNKVQVIPNFVDPSFKQVSKDFNEEKPVILHIGTKTNKNLERTIEALKGVKCHFRIIGKLTEHQQQLLDRSGIDHSNIHGLSDIQVVEEYRNCDLLCFCSTFEGFGLPILEAQATGRPVITSNASSLLEVAGQSAYMVDPYNVAAIRKGILDIIQSRTLREDLITKGLQNVKKYSLQAISNQYLNLYDQIAKQSIK